MIPGNIDLTEKLDFRNVVKKEWPQLPAIWDKNKLNTEGIKPDAITTYTNTIYHDYTDYDSIYSSDFTINYTITPQYYTTSYDTYNFNYVTTSWTFLQNNTTSSTNRIPITICCVEDKDVFGNVKNNYVKDIPKIPWKSKESDYYSRIPWEGKSLKHKLFGSSSHDYYEDIPWDEDDVEDKPRLYSEIDKAKHLISWLFDKTNSFIKNYFTSDDDVSLSYLTNMSWIRVKDAVID